MASHLCITVRFLQSLCHARGDSGEPQWPPSPLRIFQALVAGAAGRWSERTHLKTAVPALRWLGGQSPPLVVTPAAQRVGTRYRLYVPDNVGDKVAGSWSRGGVVSIADFRTEKDVCPIHLAGEAVRLVYSIREADAGLQEHIHHLKAAARSVTHVGWGIDMVVADAAILSDEQVADLPGERWLPAEGTASTTCRVPIDGTLAELMRRHAAFLNRLGPDNGFRPVPPLSAFRVVGYRRSTDPAARQFAAFALLNPDASGYKAFNPTSRTRDVAGMVRHAVARLARDGGWPDDQINEFVHGKSRDGERPASGETSADRFSYLPLPTINAKLKRVESIRRVLIAAPAHCQREIAWLRRALAGEELEAEHGQSAALVTVLPGSDWVLRRYTGTATLWSTVTPVILPRHDGYAPSEAREPLMVAFEQAGYSRDLMECAELDWRRVGYFAGADLVRRYLPPHNLQHKPRYHVRVRFPHEVSGPIAIGSGRYRGFGLFATMTE